MGASVSAAFRETVVGGLAPLGKLDCESMFGGYGLTIDGKFFGILFQDRLYLKTDDRTRERYVARGREPFRFFGMDSLACYYEVPSNVLAEPEVLREWATESLDVC